MAGYKATDITALSCYKCKSTATCVGHNPMVVFHQMSACRIVALDGVHMLS